MTLTKIELALLSAVRTALSGQPFEHELFCSLSPDDWEALQKLSAQQGLQAVVHDALNDGDGGGSAGLDIPQQVAIKWMLGADSVERNYDRQIAVGKSVAEILAGGGIPSVVLKGLAVGTFYPRPEHRECGDIDLYSGEAHLQVDSLMASHGALVKDDYYVHSHILYRGVTIENHRFFNPVRGNRERKALERHFRKLVRNGDTLYVSGTKLVVPPADFNALFLTMHAMKHFIYEGIRLRHVADWAMFLKAEQSKVDWKQFYIWTDRMHFTKFANALTYIAVQHLGLELAAHELSAAVSALSVEGDADMILEDILRSDNSVNNRGYSLWRKRLELVRNAAGSLWKYHRICHRSALVELSKTAFGMFFGRNPSA